MNISNNINNLYDKSSYFDKYGDSVFMTIFILLIFFIIYSYLWITINLQPIKDDWDNQKCKPSVIPFAGFIMNPQDKSANEFTAENFSECVQNVTLKITSVLLEPVYAFINATQTVWIDASEAIDAIRNVMNNVRTSMSDILQEIYGKTLGVMIPIQAMVISVRDFFGKVQGMMVTAMYTGLGVYDTIMTAISASWELMVIILITITAAIAILLSLFMTIPAGLVALGLYVPIAVIMVEFLALMNDTMHMSGLSKLPKIPSCFDSSTIIQTISGPINIENLESGTILSDGSLVTSIIKLDSKNETMYNLNNIIVSGSHKTWYFDKFIYVHEHPYAKKIDNYDKPYIYCFNTSNKIIIIDNHLFLDWDEISEKELDLFMKHNITSNVYKYIECGFEENTQIDLVNERKSIKNIQIGDVLINGNTVVGLVIIGSKNLDVYNYGDIIGTNLGISNNKSIVYCDKLFHLITDGGYIHIKNKRFPDYDKRIQNIIK